MQKKWLIRISLSFVIAIAVFLRFVGIYPSFPPYHPDEGMSYEQGISIVNQGSLDVHGYSLALAYPNVVPLTNAIAFKLIFLPISWASFYISHINQILDGLLKIPLSTVDYARIFQLDIMGVYEHNVLTWGRIVAAAFGVGVVLLTHILAKRMFGTATAFAASLIIAVNFRQVLNSHLDLPDIYNAFFILLSLIFSFRLITERKIKDFLLAGIFVGISFSVKFQFYTIFPLLISYIAGSLKEKKKLSEILFSPRLTVSGLGALTAVLVLNPIHLIKFEQTVLELADVSRKYGVGKYLINPYPFWYLYNYGLGKVTTLLITLGAILMLFRRPRNFFFLSSHLAAFFYVTTYYTNGGFYTRNFVSITPILVVFAGYLIGELVGLGKKSVKYLGIGLALILLILAVYENLSKSIVVAQEYTRPWNYLILSDWLSANIPAGSKIAAHSSVPLPVKNVERLPFEQSIAFSASEFAVEGADFSVINFDWESNDFYSWMNRFGLENWGKPTRALESQYSAMALRELMDYSVYSVVNSWLAPDSSFVVSKIPKFKLSDKKLVDNLGVQEPGWVSEPIDISKFDGVDVESKTKNGYIYANFFREKSDIGDITKRVAVRVSARNFSDKETGESLISQIPFDAKWVTLGFEKATVSGAGTSVIFLYNAKVDTNFSGFSVHRTIVEDGLIFPNSHGNL